MKIGWAFTGAGHLLKESVEAMEELAKDNDLTVFLSQASEEVLKMYGLYDRVVAVTGGRYNELASDSNQKFSFPITGRLSLGKYDLLIVLRKCCVPIVPELTIVLQSLIAIRANTMDCS